MNAGVAGPRTLLPLGGEGLSTGEGGEIPWEHVGSQRRPWREQRAGHAAWGCLRAAPAGSFRHSCLFSTPLLLCGEALRGALGSMGAKIQARCGRCPLLSGCGPSRLFGDFSWCPLPAHFLHTPASVGWSPSFLQCLRLKLQDLRSTGMAPGMGP